MNAVLVSQRMNEIVFKSNLGNENKTIHLEIRYDFKVANNTDKRHSIANIKYYIEDSDKQSLFNLVVGYEGIIEHDLIETDDNVKEIHVLAYEMLFPYIQAIVSQTAINAGLPSLMIPKDRLTIDRVSIENS